MHHFPFLEQHGVTACMSERSDGDGSTRAGCEALFPDSRGMILLHQVHGTTLLDSLPENNAAKADGILIQDSSRIAGIRVADCVPIWILEPEARVGALVHAGREGTVQGIAGIAVEQIRTRYTVQPENLVALVGPSAGPCCYEVSAEMALNFEEIGGIRTERHLDLWSTNRGQLMAAGLLPDSIEISEICTICGGRFHSYRGHETTARNLAILHIP
ncbi:MAG: polyphenol oxidase family protein [Candidatus Hydrogenedentota bacterium]